MTLLRESENQIFVRTEGQRGGGQDGLSVLSGMGAMWASWRDGPVCI